MAKEKATPATKKKTTEAAAGAAPRERKVREKKDSFLKDNYVTINDFREEGTGIVTKVMHIRSMGVQVREEAYQDNKLVGVSSNFIPGAKVKTKKDWKFLQIDKGPKSKKVSTQESEEEENED